MNHFSFEEARKIQSVLDLFKEFFPFQINGKNLETLIFQQGMAVDISTKELAVAAGKTGSAGTIATTLTQRRAEIEQYKATDDIVGINNLVRVLDYEGNEHFKSNYELGKKIGADFIASGAGMTSDVLKRIINQADYLGKNHYWTIPIVSRVAQSQSYFKINKKSGKHRRVGMHTVEDDESGGHSSPDAKSLQETIEEFKEADIDKQGEKIMLAGGIRTPKHVVQALDAGFDAVGIGSLALLSKEANIYDNYRNFVFNAKKGDVGKIVSPSGFHAKGFVDKGVMVDAMHGKDSLKLKCEDQPDRGCFSNCGYIEQSAKAAGVEDPGDYCIKMALWQLHTEREIYEPGPVYFSGTEPEKLFIIDHMKKLGVNSLPIKTIIGKLLEGVFDSIIDGTDSPTNTDYT